MASPDHETLPIQSANDIVLVRQATRRWMVERGFSLVEQTKMVTAASELARNTWEYGGGGAVDFDAVEQNNRQGVRLTFTDSGPGIPDIEKALSDGYTSGGGMGMGLGGSKRLVNEFSIESTVGVGTRVTITRWR